MYDEKKYGGNIFKLNDDKIYRLVWASIIDEIDYLCLLSLDDNYILLAKYISEDEIEIVNDKDTLIKILNVMGGEVSIFAL